MTRFNYNVKSLDRHLKRGRTVPAKIQDVFEKVRENGNYCIPCLVMTYITPETLEVQVYEGGADSIPSSSELGRLISRFAELGIPDIGTDEFAPLRNKYVWLKVDTIFTKDGLKYQRLPLRFLTDEEVQQYFGSSNSSLLSGLLPYLDKIKAQLQGCPRELVIAKLMPIPEIRPYLPEVNKAIYNGSFWEWLKKHTGLVLTESISG